MNPLSSSNPDITIAADPCPRCQKPLIDPNGLGWCKACGYCRSLAESERQTAEGLKPAAPDTLTATQSAIGDLPTWFWMTLIGTLAIAGATLAVGSCLNPSPLHRAVLTTVQIGIGALLMFVGQFIGLLRIAPDEPGLSFKDALFPFRLYGLIFKRLPSTRLTIYLGAWGLAAIVSAAVFIGGLDHWFNYLPGREKIQTQKAQK